MDNSIRENERRADTDAQLRTEEGAARIRVLHHGHDRTPKPPRSELPAPVEAVAKARNATAAKGRKTVAAKKRRPAAAAVKKPPAKRQTGTKVRKGA